VTAKALDSRVARYMEQSVMPAMAKLRPRLKRLEDGIRSKGFTAEDLEQDTFARILQTLDDNPGKLENIHSIERYVWRIARTRASELSRGPGLQSARYHVDKVFKSAPDKLATWKLEREVIGGLREWEGDPPVDLSDLRQTMFAMFEPLTFWRDNQVNDSAVKSAVLLLFDSVGRPVKLFQIAMLFASYWKTLNPVWLPAAEEPDREERIKAYPAWVSEGEADIGVVRDELRAALQRGKLSRKQKLALLSEIDWLALAVGEFIGEKEIADILGVEKRDLPRWLYEWTKTKPKDRKKLFDLGERPEKVVWKARQKLKKMFHRLPPAGIILCFCHLTFRRLAET
jgi:DNA-directed RNA polymerase specialized sigma24 family protein